MTAPPLEPDAEQVEAQRARTLLELAAVHVRQALAFPDDVQVLRTIVAELLLEVAIVSSRLDALERRVAR
jgi:hypothetical protein